MSKVKTNNSAGQNCSFALKGKIHNKKAKVWNMGIDPTTTRLRAFPHRATIRWAITHEWYKFAALSI
jgi:hypothetical protein